MWLRAIALLLVLEGLLPLLAPALWRQVFSELLSLRNGQLRFMGLVSLLLGCAVLLYTHF